MNFINEILHNPAALLLVALLISVFMWTVSDIYSNCFTIPKNKKDQKFTIKEIRESNAGKCVPCVREYETHYLLYIKMTWRNRSKMVVAIQMEDDGSNDGTSSLYPIHFSTREKAEEKANALSRKALGLTPDTSVTVVELS